MPRSVGGGVDEDGFIVAPFVEVVLNGFGGGFFVENSAGAFLGRLNDKREDKSEEHHAENDQRDVEDTAEEIAKHSSEDSSGWRR